MPFPEENAGLLRKANISELEEVVGLYKKAIAHMHLNGIFQWDDIYPNEKVLRKDIEKGELYIFSIDEKPAAAVVLNRKFDLEYYIGRWVNNDSSFYVVHRLCVSPDFQGMGVGRRVMLEIEKLLVQMGAKSIRLDAFPKNPAAISLYQRLGYNKVGEIYFRKGLFHLFEKGIGPG